MIVIDASALVLALVDGSERGIETRRLLTDVHASDAWFGPEHVLAETAQALRGLLLGGKVTPSDLEVARSVMSQLAVNVVPTRLILDRMWELADNLTAYDAAYVACAERLDAPMITGDRKLAAAPGTRCRFVVV